MKAWAWIIVTEWLANAMLSAVERLPEPDVPGKEIILSFREHWAYLVC